MSGAAVLTQAFVDGARLAFEFNPVAGAVAAALAALIAGSPRARRGHAVTAALVLAAGWLLGDGAAALGAASGSASGLAGDTAETIAFAVWGCGSLVFGYAAPAALGVAVGRRVFFGTGRLAAASVALACSGAVTALTRAAG